ncbi:hypothetical protein OE88DRAFT_1668325 [Heliocybe sulcata]|uniref:Fungal-type protein kinase domain-containing protein n=1 Tax=Heliocybe sulcata TaxID=5364 RepID=A0A5C3MQ22_9AGAM|nr:hypothetical protein OE88DRAFT_1668325 [Heliocybe sulcata]
MQQGRYHAENEGVRHRGRTGTWQFMSYPLLMTPSKMHTLQDDFQSSFWTLLYTVLHFIPCSLSRISLANILKIVFDEARWDDDLGCYVGGNEKSTIITHGHYILPYSETERAQIVFDPQAAPLNNLVQSLLHLFWAWDWCYSLMNRKRQLVHPTIKSDADKLLTSEVVIQLFKNAYTSPEWSHNTADSSAKRPNAEVGEQWRKTQRISQASDATSSRLEMVGE